MNDKSVKPTQNDTDRPLNPAPSFLGRLRRDLEGCYPNAALFLQLQLGAAYEVVRHSTIALTGVGIGVTTAKGLYTGAQELRKLGRLTTGVYQSTDVLLRGSRSVYHPGNPAYSAKLSTAQPGAGAGGATVMKPKPTAPVGDPHSLKAQLAQDHPDVFSDITKSSNKELYKERLGATKPSLRAGVLKALISN